MVSGELCGMWCVVCEKREVSRSVLHFRVSDFLAKSEGMEKGIVCVVGIYGLSWILGLFASCLIIYTARLS